MVQLAGREASPPETVPSSAHQNREPVRSCGRRSSCASTDQLWVPPSAYSLRNGSKGRPPGAGASAPESGSCLEGTFATTDTPTESSSPPEASFES
jgi:hypothetical protein